jgi:hypothetical protein
MSKKGLILFILTACILVACNQSVQKQNSGNGKIEFKQIDFDFGTIKQGEKVAHRFVFKNTGEGDLLIKNVIADCGCTVASFPKEAIHPGDESFIETTFNSEGYRGLCVKKIDVYTNGEPIKSQLTISSTVDVDGNIE